MNRPMVNVYELVPDSDEQVLVYREMNDDELAQWQSDQDAAAVQAVEDTRAATEAEIRGALTASDVWVIRHVEDGNSLTPERRAYRQQLRTLLETVETAKKPSKIAIPEPPAAPNL